MHHNYEYRFEIKPGKYVLVSTAECSKYGNRLVGRLANTWKPHPAFYHFGKRGGHIAAARVHLRNMAFARLDIKDFFPSVTRTKVSRALREIGFSKKEAFDIAYRSTVKMHGRHFIPYGFVQSMALATLSLERSAVGSVLRSIYSGTTTVSMYVDDILISGQEDGEVREAYERLVDAGRDAGFFFSEAKNSSVSSEVEAFNCRISYNYFSILEKRLEEFLSDWITSSDAGKAAIERYIGVINEDQLRELQRLSLSEMR